MSYAKISLQDYEIAEKFFENENHLNEFLSNVSRYYLSKPLTVKTKIVKKYFEAYKKTMDYVVAASEHGKKSALQRAENQSLKNSTLTGYLEATPDQPSTTPSTKIKINNKVIYIDRFEEFWNLYNNKTGKKKCEVVWLNISAFEYDKIILAVPLYVKATPEVKYRKNPLTWLNGEHWKDEIKQVFQLLEKKQVQLGDHDKMMMEGME